jgi:4,5-dihydroxyphthalate decarboxylase
VVEKGYYAKTGVFLIMHVIGVRRELVEPNPWLAARVLEAFTEPKTLAFANLCELAALKATPPWLVAERDETVVLMGRDSGATASSATKRR